MINAPLARLSDLRFLGKFVLFEPLRRVYKFSVKEIATKRSSGRLSFGYFSLAKQRKVTETTLGGV
ncbi:hypothetical protein X875_10770 [Mannheimia varigena USDA-ARS-USMARC-1388]|nr:hypothetical protein X875_10770 [Mannheimia varigena USDA-ARS-USMARC-1388]